MCAMADPVAKSELKIAKKAIAFVERFMGQGGLVVPEGMDDLQLAIDEPEAMQRFVRFAKAGYPDLATLPLLTSFAEPAGHQAARAILGPDFVGLDIAKRVYKSLLTDEHIEALQEIRLFDEGRQDFKLEDESLNIVDQIIASEGKQFLFPLLPVSIPQLHAVDPDRFYNDRNAPWFSERSERVKWSDKHPERAYWCAMDRDIFPGSLDKNIQAQEKHVSEKRPGFRLSLPWEYVPGALLCQTATKRKICKEYWVRFPVQSSGGYWVCADWNGERLRVIYLGGDANDYTGSCVLRTS